MGTAGKLLVEECILSVLSEQPTKTTEELISDDNDDNVDNVDDDWKVKPVVVLLVHTLLEADRGGGLSSALLNSIPFGTITDEHLAIAEIEAGVVVCRLLPQELAVGDCSAF